MNSKISVITVCFNAESTIEETILSVVNQSYTNIEYIIIDGGSTDGTLDVIKRYEKYIDFFVSEPDKGIYDAMNKGVLAATGDWINILNSGDVYADNNSLSNAISIESSEIDIIYGNSIERDSKNSTIKHASEDVTLLEMYPIYRHGSSLVRSEVHKSHLFDLKRTDLNYALDWEMIHRLYVEGYVFKKAPFIIESYMLDGVSNHQILNRWYNYKITSNGHFDLEKALLCFRSIFLYCLCNNTICQWMKSLKKSRV